MIQFDTEGFTFKTGLKVPDPVCFQINVHEQGPRLLSIEDGFDEMTRHFVNGETILGVNLAYDLMAYIRAGELLGIPCNQTGAIVMDALIQNRCLDLSLCEALLMLGTVGRVPGMAQRSLAALEKKYLGIDRSGDKQGDVWRLKYAQLAETNIEFWPDEAVKYALDDVSNMELIYRKMTRKDIYAPAGDKAYPLVKDGVIVNSHFQTLKAFCMFYISSQGINVDPDNVNKREKELLDEFIALSKQCFKAGFLSLKDKKIKLPQDENAAFEIVSKYMDEHFKSAFAQVYDEDYEDDEDEDEDEEKALTVSYGRLSPFKRNMNIIRSTVAAAYMAAGLKPPLTESGKNVASGKDAIEQCPTIIKGHPLYALLERGKREKQLSTYIKGMKICAALGVPACPDFNPLVNTGRTSSFGLFPVQVIPKKGNIRPCVKAGPGKLLVDVDLGSQEVRCLAQAMLILGIPNQIVAKFQADPWYDPHTDFATSLMRFDGVTLTYKEALDVKKDKSHPLHAKLLARRQQSKVANFGFPGGMGAMTLIAYAKGYGLNLTYEDAVWLRQQWLAFEPGFADYLKYIGEITSWDTYYNTKRRELVPCGTVQQLFTGRVRAKVPYTGAANTYFQGLAADAAVIATYLIVRAVLVGDVYEDLYGARIWHHIHDAWGIEVDEDKADAATDALQEAIIDGVSKFHPDVPCVCEPTIGKEWS